MIDLSAMKRCASIRRRARACVEAGALLADVDHETQAYGLATPLGINSTTGVAGLTLGGGFGWLSRKYGLTVDNLRRGRRRHRRRRAGAAPAPTRTRTCSGRIRGGGGNFGVVTRVRVRAAPGRPAGAGRPDRLSRSPRRRRCCARYRDFVADGARRADRLGRAAQGAAAAVPAAPRCTARRSWCWPCCYRGDLDAGRSAGRAAARLRHAARRARRRRCRTPPGSRRSIRCWRRARATTGSRTTSPSSPTARSTSCIDCASASCRRRSARSSSAQVGGAANRAGAGRHGLPAPRRAVRDERARPLGRRRPTTQRVHRLGARVLRGRGAVSPPAASTSTS